MKNDYSLPRELYYSMEVDTDALIIAKAEAYARVVDVFAHRGDKTIYKQDRMRVEYSNPDRGWLQTKIFINGEMVLDIHFSDYNAPLRSLIRWLEAIIDNRGYGSVVFNEDLEGDSAIFIKDGIGYNDKDISLFIALNSWHATDEREFPHGSAIVCTEDIVLAFYRPLIRLYERLAFERYHGHMWFRENDGSSSPLQLLETLRSEKIEKYLSAKHVWP